MLKKTLAALALGTALLTAGQAMAADYTIDKEGQHAFIDWKVSHLGFSFIHGTFKDWSGTFSWDAAKPADSKIDVTLKTASLFSNHAERDKHIASKDFLDVSKYPQATFKSTKVVPTGEKTADVTGDLTLHGVTEPYRMLTARAEYRLRLRANNASTRLTPLAMAAGCVGSERAEWFRRRAGERARLEAALERSATSAELAGAGLPVRTDAGRLPLREWLRFSGVSLGDLAPWLGEPLPGDSELCAEIGEDAAYAPYLARQEGELRDLRASETLLLGDDFPYAAIPGLSREMVERLSAARPATLAAAGRVPGITPAALAALLVHARRRAA